MVCYNVFEEKELYDTLFLSVGSPELPDLHDKSCFPAIQELKDV
jgi:hypothetical protein